MRAFVLRLQASGFSAEAYALPSVGDARKGMDDDEKSMRSVLMSHIEHGRDVLLIVHSFAGNAACGAISGLAKTGKSNNPGKPGVIGIVYLAAFAPPLNREMLRNYRKIYGYPDGWMQAVVS